MRRFKRIMMHKYVEPIWALPLVCMMLPIWLLCEIICLPYTLWNAVVQIWEETSEY